MNPKIIFEDNHLLVVNKPPGMLSQGDSSGDLSLIDYKVRILNTGTDAITRVSIESSDANKKSWYTIGVSENIIEASWQALQDSFNYKLLKSQHLIQSTNENEKVNIYV